MRARVTLVRMRHEFKAGGSVLAAELDESTGVLTVEFRGGTTKQFAGFTGDKFAEWQAAEKPGKFYHDKIAKAYTAPGDVAEVVEMPGPNDRADGNARTGGAYVAPPPAALRTRARRQRAELEAHGKKA